MVLAGAGAFGVSIAVLAALDWFDTASVCVVEALVACEERDAIADEAADSADDRLLLRADTFAATGDAEPGGIPRLTIEPIVTPPADTLIPIAPTNAATLLYEASVTPESP